MPFKVHFTGSIRIVLCPEDYVDPRWSDVMNIRNALFEFDKE